MNHSRKRKMIPFGNRLNRRIYKYCEGVKGSAVVILFAGGQEAWEEAESNSLAYYKEWLSWPGNILCLPEITRAANYQYPVQNLDVLVWLTKYPDEIGLDILMELVDALFSDGARSICFQSIYAEQIEPDYKPYYGFNLEIGIYHG